MRFDDDLTLAHWLADLAATIALPLFESGTSKSVKADGTIVTTADIEVERQLCDALVEQRPDDGILSEEGSHRVGTRRRWILDPIDGTVNFAVGNPGWGTHIALEESGEIVLGIITRPVHRRKWWAKRGEGAFESVLGHPDVALAVSSVDTLAHARVTAHPNAANPVVTVLRGAGIWTEAETPMTGWHRYWGCMGGLLHGELEAVIAASGGPWDHAPAVVIVEEAGGRFRDPAGGHRIDLGGGTYSNGRIDDELEALLRGGA